MLLDSRQHSLGNGALQSRASFGAIITPIIMQALMTTELGSWRTPFKVVGAVGLLWILPWLLLMRTIDLSSKRSPGDVSNSRVETATSNFWRVIFSRQMLIVFFVIACINTT